jgi:transcriptional regulator with XRE-family HTH domain
MPDTSFSHLLHQQRKEMKLSLRQVSQMSGLAASTISRIENGLYSPTLDNAQKLAAALNMELHSTGDSLVQPEAEASSPLRSSNDVGLNEENFIEQGRIKLTTVKVGFRRNLSKVAARESFERIILLKGAIQLRNNRGFDRKVTAGAIINCRLIREHTFYAVASEEAELLWLG